MALLGRLFVYFAKALDGEVGSMLLSFSALLEDMKFSRCLFSRIFISTCFAAVLLIGSCFLIVLGSFFTALDCPPAAILVCLSAFSLPTFPSCPGTHLRVHVISCLQFAIVLSSSCKARTRCWPAICFPIKEEVIAAWLSRAIVTPSAAVALLAKCAPKIVPTISAS